MRKFLFLVKEEGGVVTGPWMFLCRIRVCGLFYGDLKGAAMKKIFHQTLVIPGQNQRLLLIKTIYPIQGMLSFLEAVEKKLPTMPVKEAIKKILGV